MIPRQRRNVGISDMAILACDQKYRCPEDPKLGPLDLWLLKLYPLDLQLEQAMKWMKAINPFSLKRLF
jgi:hypothetical protein